MLFKNRREAGEKLAQKLGNYTNLPNGIILALPRGGVEIAAPITEKIHWPLDVFISRKIAHPNNPEYAIGAISELGETNLNFEATKNLPENLLQKLIKEQQKEIARRQKIYRQGKFLPDLKGKTVLLVDDGIATGFSLNTAIASLRQQKLAKLIVAVPVAPPEAIAKLKNKVDDLICLHTPAVFFAVGQFYADFPQTSDATVIQLLNQFHFPDAK